MQETFAIHYVCTHEEAAALIAAQERFWLSNCGCREGRGGCTHSRMDVCLGFAPTANSGGHDLREVSRAEVAELLAEAAAKHLVTRPFRSAEDPTITEGICFCCSCCCGYFLDGDEVCDKGKLLEETEQTQCVNCGSCVEVCYFHARSLVDGELVIDRDACYGCGLCQDVCAIECIKMVAME